MAAPERPDDQTPIVASDDLFRVGALPPFATLRAFEAVFRTGGIRRAAISLNLSHAVISRHIKLLEEWVGAPLLTRQSNRLALTDEGKRYHARISAAFAELALATREFMKQQRQDFLRLWCIPGLSIQWLSERIAAFERANPGFHVELKPTEHPANLLIHEADADIRYHRDDEDRRLPAGIRYFELARPDIMAVASPSLLGSLAPLARPADLLTAPLLHEEHNGEWRLWLKLNGVDAPIDLGGALCWQAHLAIASARQGRGIALASKFLVQQDLAQGSLVEVKVPGTVRVPLGSYGLAAREDRWSLPILAALRRFLRDAIAETGVDAD